MAKAVKKKAKKKKETELGAQALQAEKVARDARKKADASGALDDEKRAGQLEERAALMMKRFQRETFERVGGRYVRILLDAMRKLAKLADSPKVHFEGTDLQMMFTTIDARKNQLFEQFNKAEELRRLGPQQTGFRFPKLQIMEGE
jgi:hypothetical protein